MKSTLEREGSVSRKELKAQEKGGRVKILGQRGSKADVLGKRGIKTGKSGDCGQRRDKGRRRLIPRVSQPWEQIIEAENR